VGLALALLGFVDVPLRKSDTAHQVIGLAIDVHRTLGPGLFESTYHRCLRYELGLHGFDVACQVPVPIRYKEVVLDCAYRADMIVNEELLLELKSVSALLPIHQAQVLTYLRLTGLREGLLINFNVHRLVDGLRSFLL
jgi:GxxExxY protein